MYLEFILTRFAFQFSANKLIFKNIMLPKNVAQFIRLTTSAPGPCGIRYNYFYNAANTQIPIHRMHVGAPLLFIFS